VCGYRLARLLPDERVGYRGPHCPRGLTSTTWRTRAGALTGISQCSSSMPSDIDSNHQAGAGSPRRFLTLSSGSSCSPHGWRRPAANVRMASKRSRCSHSRERGNRSPDAGGVAHGSAAGVGRGLLYELYLFTASRRASHRSHLVPLDSAHIYAVHGGVLSSRRDRECLASFLGGFTLARCQSAVVG